MLMKLLDWNAFRNGEYAPKGVSISFCAFLCLLPTFAMNEETFMATLHDTDNTLLALVRTTFDAHSAVLFLPDQSGNYSLALSSTDDVPLVQQVSIAPGKGLVGWILRHRQPVIVNNLDMRHTFLGYYAEEEEEHISAFMGCHIPEGGALCVDSIRPRSFTEADQLLLHRFARHIARQVHSAGLASDAQDLRRYFDRLEQLTELSSRHPQWREYLHHFLLLMAESTYFDYVAFASSAEGSTSYTLEGENTPLLIEENQAMPELPLTGGGLVSWVFRNEVPVHAEGADGSPSTPLFGKIQDIPNFQSVMCLPVQLNKVTCGVLCLAGLEPRQLPENLRAFARMAVALLSRHLEVIFLRHRLKNLLPKARVHRDGALAYDPDTAPAAPLNEDD